MFMKTLTFELPEYDEYKLEPTPGPIGTYISSQKYYNKGELVTQIDIYFKMRLDNSLPKAPCKFVIHTKETIPTE